MKKTEAQGAVVPNVGSERQYEAKLAPLNVLSQNLDRWRQIAAQAWCKPNTSHIEMDTRIAEEFAKLLAEAVSAETLRCAMRCRNIYTGDEGTGDWPTPEQCADAILQTESPPKET